MYGAQLSNKGSKREVVKDLIRHIKYFECYPDGNGSLWKFLNRGAMKTDV